MKLLKHANVYTPAPLGKRDVLIEGERILRIAEEITGYDELPDVDVYDLSGKTLVPAYIDLHVHITGGGGEQGHSARFLRLVSRPSSGFWARTASREASRSWWRRPVH